MSDLISRSVLIEKIKERIERHSKDYQAFRNYSGDRKTKDIAKWDECEAIIDIAKELPTVETKPVVYGEWMHEWNCSECGCSYMDYADGDSDRAYSHPLPNFCPNCGCSMKKE